jgi:hypothetical protein
MKSIRFIKLFIFTLVTLLYLMFNLTNGHALSLGLTGSGGWIQQNSMDNPNIYSQVFDWYITDASNMDEAFVNQLGRPLIMAFSGKNIDRLKERIDQNLGRIVAVAWDYELGSTQAQAEADLKEARAYANQRGLPFGVVVLAAPPNSIKTNGVDYGRANQFADFLMPMLYCQWWGNRANSTRETYARERQATDLPLLPVITLNATAEVLNVHVVTPEEMIANYAGLMPKPQAFCYYQLTNLNNDYLNAIRTVEGK